MQSEHQQPPPLPVTASSSGGRPAGVLFYRWWCVFFVAIYLGMAFSEILVATGRVEPDLGLLEAAVSYENPKVRAEIIADKRVEAPGVAVFMALIAVLYGFAACVPRKPWAWTFSLVMICTTIFPFVITAAGTVPLIMLWAKPVMRTYFKISSTASPSAPTMRRN